MTKEEAIYLLNNLRSVAEGKEDEALDMAIEALSADAVHTCNTCADKALCIMSAPDGNWRACKDYRPSADRPIIEHDREWIIGCIKHDGFIKTDRFDKANQIILEALEPTEPTDLISRADAIEAVRYLIYDRQEKGAKPFKWWFIKQRLNAIPSADRPTIVRCKDCEYYTDGKCYYPHGYHDVAVYRRVNDNDFCSWAKMKGGAE